MTNIPPDILSLAAAVLVPCEAKEYCGCCSKALREARVALTPTSKALIEQYLKEKE